MNTLGFLAGEIVRRVSGESIGAFFRREVAEPLGADFHFGFGAEEDHRVAEYTFGSEIAGADGSAVRARRRGAAVPPAPRLPEPARPVGARHREHACMARGRDPVGERPRDRPGGGPDIRRSCGRRRPARPGDVEQAIAEHSAGPDFVLGRPSRFGLGFQLTQPERPLGPNPRSFGHFGVGGSLGFADPDAGLAFAYAMNRSGPRWQNPRNRALIDAVYASL